MHLSWTRALACLPLTGVFLVACSNAEPADPGVSSGSTVSSSGMGTQGSGVTTTSTGASVSNTGSASGTGGSTNAVTSSTGTNEGSEASTSGGAGGMPNLIVPGTEGFDCTPSDGSTVTLKLTHLVGDLAAPTGIYQPPGETERLFITLQGGRIEILEGGSITGTFLDLSERVDADETMYDERGLLALAFHPDFQTNGRFFVTYTSGDADDGGLTEYVSEFTSSGASADMNSERVFLSFPHPENNHNGSGMAIGLDGYLYVSLGDGGWETPAADMYDNAQNPQSPLGAILRFTLDGEPAPGNMPGAAPEVWDKGLRNPWRITTDGCTGDLYIADVGYEEEDEDSSPPTEEINVEPPGAGHKNYGWPVMEGDICREEACDTSGLVLPVDSYPTIPGNAIIGGYVYRGRLIPGLRGTYLYADWGMASFWAFRYENGAVVDRREITSDINPDGFNTGAIVSFGQDSSGEMYVIAWTQDEAEGSPHLGDVYRIEPE
ncbi:MAG TPA: PQQ-dependent sugar dehydrogenase [Polyangiaceae bacterium]|nr:PQQ-dependent sugar dehydrogenase [Polyangiaceae bacterium]